MNKQNDVLIFLCIFHYCIQPENGGKQRKEKKSLKCKKEKEKQKRAIESNAMGLYVELFCVFILFMLHRLLPCTS